MCCNKDWDLTSLERESDFTPYEMVILTGGEPMLNPGLVVETVFRIKRQINVPVIMYTAKMDDIHDIHFVLKYLDGVTLTLHEQKDVEPFLRLNDILERKRFKGVRLLRLNIFRGVKLPENIDLSKWVIKDDIVWIKDCPLPKDEVFKRL